MPGRTEKTWLRSNRLRYRPLHAPLCWNCIKRSKNWSSRRRILPPLQSTWSLVTAKICLFGAKEWFSCLPTPAFSYQSVFRGFPENRKIELRSRRWPQKKQECSIRTHKRQMGQEALRFRSSRAKFGSKLRYFLLWSIPKQQYWQLPAGMSILYH